MISKFTATNKEAIFEELYHSQVEPVYNFLFYKTLDKEAAADLTQEVFLKAWRALDKTAVDNPRAWLYTISRYAVIDYYRKLKPQANIDDCWDLADNFDTLKALDQKLTWEKVAIALKLLPASDRDLLIMRFWLDLPFADIATSLEKNEGATKMACARALKKLQTHVSVTVLIASITSLSNL